MFKAVVYSKKFKADYSADFGAWSTGSTPLNLENRKNLPDKPTWRDGYFTVDELKYYQETVHAYVDDW